MRNPVRRSRKIGRTQGGRVQDGRAYEKWSRVFSQDIWTRLSEDPAEGCRVLRENPSRDHYHPCSGNEILEVLGRLPARHADPVRAIVLRRTPKLDEKLGVEARLRYACVILNSFPCSRSIVWRPPPGAAVRRHYSRWCQTWEEDAGVPVLR